MVQYQLSRHLTSVRLTNRTANHVGKAVRGKEGGRSSFSELWHLSLPPCCPASASVWIEVSGTDDSISERVSLGLFSSAKSVAHAV